MLNIFGYNTDGEEYKKAKEKGLSDMVAMKMQQKADDLAEQIKEQSSKQVKEQIPKKENTTAGESLADALERLKKTIEDNYKKEQQSVKAKSHESQKSVIDEYSSKKQDAEDSAENKKQDAFFEIEDLERKRNQDLDDMKANHETEKEEIKNSAIKKGVGRSSILEEEINESVQKYLTDIARKNADYDYKEEKLNRKIENIDEDLEKTVKGLDEKSKSKILSILESAIKSASKIKQAESPTVVDAISSKYGKNYGSNRQAVMTDLFNYYLDYDKSTALDMFQNDKDLKKYLGDDYSVMLGFLNAREK